MANLKYMPLKEWRQAVKDGAKPEGIFVRKDYVAELKPGKPEERKISAIISTGAVDRDSDTVRVRGWQLDRFKANPVVLWAHQAQDLPVAKASNVGLRLGRIEPEDRLVSDTEFPAKGVYQKSDWVYGLAEGGFLKGTSVGFTPSNFEKNIRRGGVDFLEQELMEYSFVSIPSNPEALVQAKTLAIEGGKIGYYTEAMKGLLADLAGDDLGEVLKRWEAAARFVEKGKITSITVPEIKSMKMKPSDEDTETVDNPAEDAQEMEPHAYQDNGKGKCKVCGMTKAGHEAKMGKSAAVPAAGKPVPENTDHVHKLKRDKTDGVLRCTVCGTAAYVMTPEEDGSAADSPKSFHEELIQKYISESNGEYLVHSEAGKVLGRHKTRADAVNQLQAIEANKHRGGKDAEAIIVKDTFDGLVVTGDFEAVNKAWPPKKPAQDAPPDPNAQPDPNAPPAQAQPAQAQADPNAPPAQKPPANAPPKQGGADPNAEGHVAPAGGDQASAAKAVTDKIASVLGQMDPDTFGAAVQVLEQWLGQLGIQPATNQNQAPVVDGKQKPQGAPVATPPEGQQSKGFIFMEDGTKIALDALQASIIEEVQRVNMKLTGYLPGDKE